MEVSLTSGWSRTLHLGDLKCPFRFEMRSATNSLNYSFHSERYLSSTCSLLGQFCCIEINGFQKHCFCSFSVDPIWFSLFWSFRNKFPQFGILYDPLISSNNMAMSFIAKLGFLTLARLWIREIFRNIQIWKGWCKVKQFAGNSASVFIWHNWWLFIFKVNWNFVSGWCWL